ncbi:Xylose isomerase protein [Raphanus sativus]|nr:Xylose isomerase protein [Raphanus sativus]
MDSYCIATPSYYEEILFLYDPCLLKRSVFSSDYVFWGGREGYQTLLNTDMERELDHMPRFFETAVAYKQKIGFNGTLLMRREITDIEDLFIAHISGMDTVARGLKNAAKILEVSSFPSLLVPFEITICCIVVKRASLVSVPGFYGCSNLHKLEVLEKLEAKLKAEGKEEENGEGEGDDEADESEGHYLSQETALPFPHTSSLHLLHCRQTLDSTQTHHLKEALVHSLLRKRSSLPSRPRPRIPAAS